MYIYICINMNIMLSNPLIQNGSDIEYYWIMVFIIGLFQVRLEAAVCLHAGLRHRLWTLPGPATHSGSALRGTRTPWHHVEAVELCSASKFSEKTAGHCTQLSAELSWTQRNFDVGRFSQISKIFSSILDAHILQHSPAVHHLWSALGIWPLLCFLLTTTTWCAWSWTAWRQTWHLAMRQGQCFKKNMWTIVFYVRRHADRYLFKSWKWAK